MAFGSTHSCFLGLVVLVVSSVPLGVHTYTVEEWSRDFYHELIYIAPTGAPALHDQELIRKAFTSFTGMVESIVDFGINEIKHTVVGLGPTPTAGVGAAGVDQFQTGTNFAVINDRTEVLVIHKDAQKMDFEMWLGLKGDPNNVDISSSDPDLQKVIREQRPHGPLGEPTNYFTGADMSALQYDLSQLEQSVNNLNMAAQGPFDSINGQLTITVSFAVVGQGVPPTSGPNAVIPLSSRPNVIKTILSYIPKVLSTTSTTSTSTTSTSTTSTSTTSTSTTDTSTVAGTGLASIGTSPFTSISSTTSGAMKSTVYGVCMASSILFASVMLLV